MGFFAGRLEGAGLKAGPQMTLKWGGGLLVWWGCSNRQAKAHKWGEKRVNTRNKKTVGCMEKCAFLKSRTKTKRALKNTVRRRKEEEVWVRVSNLLTNPRGGL